ncbi:hypothetical protein ACFFKC_09910 [Pseudoduganella danionis]|uniref:Uncharacterized protein n=1 Tax=Pseudoduganella danionis TaxID=1890295 RepID=A0ABW9SLZ5_9BURK|nr:hypothetical protein [Pseudoduganella danionis]MTW32661.1 hypothetical protein [Pseudoduganella danionis]
MSVNVKTWQERMSDYYELAGAKQIRNTGYFKSAEISALRTYADLAATRIAELEDELRQNGKKDRESAA